MSSPPRAYAGVNTDVGLTVHGRRFTKFIADMRKATDFWKGKAYAQVLVMLVDMIFGVVVYSYSKVQGISDFEWQTATKVISLITGLIAAALCGNIGVKVRSLSPAHPFPHPHPQR